MNPIQLPELKDSDCRELYGWMKGAAHKSPKIRASLASFFAWKMADAEGLEYFKNTDKHTARRHELEPLIEAVLEEGGAS